VDILPGGGGGLSSTSAAAVAAAVSLHWTSAELSVSNRGATVRQLVGRPTGIQPRHRIHTAPSSSSSSSSSSTTTTTTATVTAISGVT